MLDFAYVKRVEGQSAPWRADESADCLLRFVGRVPLVAFGVGGGAGVYAVASAVVVPSAPNDRAREYDRYKQEDRPSIQHFSVP